MYIRRILYLLLFLPLTVPVFSATDSTAMIAIEAADTAASSSRHSPPLATVMSAIVPGAGQVYNQKYWKVPIIYAGFAGLAYGFYYNHSEYTYYNNLIKRYYMRDSLIQDGTIRYGANSSASVENVKAQRDYNRRNRDLFVIIAGGWYILNIIDANVDAHFFDYDIGDDLSLQWQPVLQPYERQTAFVGANLVIRF